MQGGLSGRKVQGKSAKTNVNDPAVCLSYQNQIKSMYPPGTSGSLDGADVSVTALSDSDTPMSATASPDPGSSSTSDKLRSLVEMEHLDLSNEQLDLSTETDTSSKSRDNRRGLEDVVSRTSFNENEKSIGNTSEDQNHKRNKFKEIEMMCDNNVQKDSEIVFERNGLNRNSDMSDASSVSQGKFDRDSGIRHSDMSDLSMDGDGRLTPKNQRDLEMYLQQIDETSVHQLSGESGIVSESASSNHSEGSQQSDQSDFRFDPSEIARKVMSEVSAHKNALDNLQKRSMVQSQMESNNLRNEFKNQTQPSIMSQATSLEHSAHLPDSKLSASATEISLKPETSVQSKISVTSPTNSAFTSPTHKPRVPPPVAAKPAYTFQSNPAAFRNLSTNVSNLALSSVSESAENLVEDSDKTQPPLQVQSTKSDIATTTAITLNKKDSFSSASSVNTSMSFSSFRPSNKMNFAEGGNQGRGSLYRPDSATSTSSYCSTPSSVQSVIYKPIIKESESPNITAYDSSSDQTSGSGSTSTVTPTINLSDIQNNSSQKRDASPALSTGSSASSKSGKPKKKVSFSDSEPSDTPSPLNLSSNHISYFDINRGAAQYTHNLPTWSYGVDNGSKHQTSHLSGLKQVLGLKDSQQKSRNKGPSPPVKYSQENVPKSPRDYLPKTVPPVTSTNMQINDSNSSRESTSVSSLSSPRESISSINSASVSSLSSPVSPGSLSSLNSPLLPGSDHRPVAPPQQQNQRAPHNQPPPYGQPPPSYRQAIQKINPPNNLPLSSPKHQVSPSRTLPFTSSSQESKVTLPNYFPPPLAGFGGSSVNVSRAPLRTFQEQSQNFHGDNRHFQGQSNKPQSDHLQGHSSQGQPNRPQGNSSQGHSSQGQPSTSQGNHYQGQPALPPYQNQSDAFTGQPLGPGQGHISPQQQYSLQTNIPQFSPSRKVPNYVDQLNYNPSQQDLSSRYTVYPAVNGPNEQIEMKNFQTDLVNRPPNYNSPNYNTGPQRRPPVPPARIDSWENMDRKLNQPLSPDQPLSKSYPLLASQHTSPKHNLLVNQPLSQSYHRVPQSPGGRPEMGPNKTFSQDPLSLSAGSNSQIFTGPVGDTRVSTSYHNNLIPTQAKIPNGNANYDQFPNDNIPNNQNFPRNTQVYPANNNVLNNSQLPNGGQLRRVTLGNDKKSFTRSNVLHSSKC